MIQFLILRELRGFRDRNGGAADGDDLEDLPGMKTNQVTRAFRSMANLRAERLTAADRICCEFREESMEKLGVRPGEP